MFSVEIARDRDTGERRGGDRNTVNFAGRITTRDQWRAVCRITDLSRTGARLRTYSALEEGATIWVRLPGVEQRTATIMWADDFAAGCHFADPLSDTELDILTAAYSFTPGGD
jgi:hypothetical protein